MLLNRKLRPRKHHDCSHNRQGTFTPERFEDGLWIQPTMHSAVTFISQKNSRVLPGFSAWLVHKSDSHTGKPIGDRGHTSRKKGSRLITIGQRIMPINAELPNTAIDFLTSSPFGIIRNIPHALPPNAGRYGTSGIRYFISERRLTGFSTCLGEKGCDSRTR